MQREEYVINQLEPETVETKPEFKGFDDVIHVDEKWFNVVQVNQRILLVPGEEPPHRTCKSKRFIATILQSDRRTSTLNETWITNVVLDCEYGGIL